MGKGAKRGFGCGDRASDKLTQPRTRGSDNATAIHAGESAHTGGRLFAFQAIRLLAKTNWCSARLNTMKPGPVPARLRAGRCAPRTGSASVTSDVFFVILGILARSVFG